MTKYDWEHEKSILRTLRKHPRPISYFQLCHELDWIENDSVRLRALGELVRDELVRCDFVADHTRYSLTTKGRSFASIA